VPQKGFKTMPLRWSKYDRYKAECAAEDMTASSDTEPPSQEGTPPSDGISDA
jgi:hypothetical protein